MTKKCEVTGKRPGYGYKYVTRGIAKKKKGIGLKVTGKTKRRFLPNLVEKRLWYPEEKRWVRLRLAISSMRTIEKVGLHAMILKMRERGQRV